MYELVPSRESAMQPVRRVGRRVCAGAPYLWRLWAWLRAAAGQIVYKMVIVQLNNVVRTFYTFFCLRCLVRAGGELYFISVHLIFVDCTSHSHQSLVRELRLYVRPLTQTRLRLR